MQNIDWKNIGFGYKKCNCNVRMHYLKGEWSEMSLHQEDTFEMHIAAPALHYGSEIFEGIKAFRGEDGKVRIFRPYDNARRMIASAERLCMKAPSEQQFVDACAEAVRQNIDFVPPYGTGASLYIRPFLIGTNSVLGISPATEFMFCVFVSPVGAYFKGGMTTIKVRTNVEFDRAAPRGTGDVKCGGNYAAGLMEGENAHSEGYSNVLYLDAAERKYVEECGAANFFGIKEGKYVTPASPSILPSITNLSLCQIAEDMGLLVERRAIPFTEVSSFEECGACGTAAVISPIGSVFNSADGSTIDFGSEVGSTCVKMYNQLQDIQYGRSEDKYGWNFIVE